MQYLLERNNLHQIEGEVARLLGRSVHRNWAGFGAAMSDVANLSPVGDAKGVLEAIWGRDLMAERDLHGAERWLGLAGLIGFAEFRYASRLADGSRVARVAANAGAYVTRRVDEGMMTRLINCGRSAFNSFSADTKVATATGAVAISTIAKGKEVLAYNEETGETGYYPVTATHEHLDPVIIHLTVDPDLNDNNPGELIETTPEHPFYVNGTWVNAGELEAGMPVSSPNGQSGIEANGTVTAAKRIEIPQVMYNLTVDTAHTFFVGEGEWLVHNTGPCGGAFVSVDKFSRYVLDPVNSKGKHVVFEGLGYTVNDAEALAKIYQDQALAKFRAGNYTLGKLDQYGQRVSIVIDLPGVGARSGKTSRLTSGWMINPDGTIQLTTPFSGFAD